MKKVVHYSPSCCMVPLVQKEQLIYERIKKVSSGERLGGAASVDIANQD